MTTNDSKSGLGYLNKLVDEYNIFFFVLLGNNLFTLIILL